MFQSSEIIAIFREYDHRRTSPSPKVCAAVNIVYVMLEPPDSVTIGALLLMALFLSSTSRLSTSAMVLGVASQMMFLAGFHKISTTLADRAIHNHRLLSHAYILDQNLSLWLGKPPLLSSDIVRDVPKQEQYDGYGSIYLQDGTSFNCLKEQLFLAKIQSKAYEKLRSPSSSSMSQELHAEISHQLLNELNSWRHTLPALTRPLLIPKDLDKKHVPWLSTIFCTFHQVENCIRSSIFSHVSFFDNVAFRNQTPLVVSSCASATRKLVAVLNALDRSDLQRS
ncbi:fungal specific transcription factor domain-containing protein [Colletotrichum abscissum]|uniref:fungal specific transcription factor domain-containing protein n=1 Tax=Colletotrichum abscissum TaxID=1671311 RepID=UPI0027D6B2FB|nr:fungal specific transcription factor domain-containing protein [Colletotrichum abscissum]KAK1488421.1 fungal specific transcription factor domain-containing protein [Colletotrichum abscissum]